MTDMLNQTVVPGVALPVSADVDAAKALSTPVGRECQLDKIHLEARFDIFRPKNGTKLPYESYTLSVCRAKRKSQGILILHHVIGFRSMKKRSGNRSNLCHYAGTDGYAVIGNRGDVVCFLA